MKPLERRFSAIVRERVELPYLLFPPDQAPPAGVKPPLLVFLHGGGERGADLALLGRHGPPRRIAQGARFPFAVAAPQCPADGWWRAGPLAAFVDHLLAGGAFDGRRVYLTGLSMGGYGAWVLADARPGRFAAVAPICAPQAWVNPAHFRDTPTWCFHGAMDRVVPLGDSVAMVRQLRAAGAQVRFTVFPDAGHDAWTRVYRGPELYDWLLAQCRG